MPRLVRISVNEEDLLFLSFLEQRYGIKPRKIFAAGLDFYRKKHSKERVYISQKPRNSEEASFMPSELEM